MATSSMFFLSCAEPVTPLIGSDGEVSVIRPSNLSMQQGLQEFAELKSQKKVSTNAGYNAQLERVSSRLKQVVQMPGARWEFVVFEDASPNAFALPGGKVGVHTGLFEITKNDAGLAAVVGHEIAHITRNHAASRQQQAASLNAVGLIIDKVAKGRGVSDDERTQLGSLYGSATAVGVDLPHSRNAELEADKIGVIYMAKAGYDPQEAVAMWERFAEYKLKKSNGQPELLSTHPLDHTRIHALKAFIPKVQKVYVNR